MTLTDICEHVAEGAAAPPQQQYIPTSPASLRTKTVRKGRTRKYKSADPTEVRLVDNLWLYNNADAS